MWYFIAEALVAAMLLVGMLFVTYAAERPVEIEALYIKSRIWNGLKAMDDAGSLRGYALANKTEEIKSALSQMLPGMPLVVSICDEPCVAPLPYEKAVIVSYFLAGEYGSFKPTAVVVGTWFE